MPTPILVTGLLLGALQLAAGVGIGLWIGRAKAGPGEQDQDGSRARRLADELRTLTAGMSAEARKQGDVLQRVHARLGSEGANAEQPLAEHPLTSMVTGVVREMMAANQQLQQKLASTEMELEAQSVELSEHLQKSMTDSLTGLPNRRALDDHLNLRMEAWRRHRTQFSLVMMDVDHFKQFNDTHGHAAGDEALKAVGAALRQSLRQHDVVARYGGEEFAVILPHTNLQTAQMAVLKAVGAVRSARVMVQGTPVEVTASAGLASLETGESSKDLLRRADEALYAAKEHGRDRAWKHDSKALKPLDEPDGREQAADQPPEDPDLADACGDLRLSLAEFLSDGASEPASKR